MATDRRGSSLRGYTGGLASLLVGCAWDSRANQDNALVLGMGTVLDALVDTLTGNPYEEEAPRPVTAVEPPFDDSWRGNAAIALTAGEPPEGGCTYDPCEDGGTAVLTLDEVFVRGGGEAAGGDADFDCNEDSVSREHCDQAKGFDLDPPDFVIDGRAELALGWTVAEGAAAWRVVTLTPASLRVTALGLDRTAEVSIDYAADWDEFSGRFETRGTVDGDASGYDWSFND